MVYKIMVYKVHADVQLNPRNLYYEIRFKDSLSFVKRLRSKRFTKDNELGSYTRISYR